MIKSYNEGPHAVLRAASWNHKKNDLEARIFHVATCRKSSKQNYTNPLKN